MRSSQLWFAAAGLGAALLAGSAHATQFMNINFDGDTVSQPPATDTSTALPLTKPYSIGGYDYAPDPNNGNYASPPTAADGTIAVSGASKNTTWATNSGDNQVGALWLDTQYSVPTGSLQLKFNLNVLAASQITGQSSTLLSNSTTVHPVFGVNTFSSGDILKFNAVPTSSTGGVYGIRTSTGIQPFYSYTNGDNHLIELDADYTTGKVNVLVDGVSQLTGYAFGTPAASVNLSESFFYLNGDTTAGTPISDSIALDNISGVVPEPASLAMLGLGALSLARRRRA